MEDQLKIQYKNKILGVLKYCIAFFEKHDIQWFIACGSAIGAIRHKGIIPWDDDIDIYMPRSDYNKLFELRDEMLNEGFRFVCLKDEGYPYAFGKVMDMNTTLWQERRYPFNVGCYVDIFPLDLTDMGMMSFGKKWRTFRDLFSKYRAKIAKVSFGDIIDDIKARRTDGSRVVLGKIALMFYSRSSLHARLLSLEDSWNKIKGDRFVSFTESGMYMFPKEWFLDYILVPFEDIEVRIPVSYDAYLTYIYGDYMTPPPIEQRKGDGPHGKIYINLDRNIPLEKIRRRRII